MPGLKLISVSPTILGIALSIFLSGCVDKATNNVEQGCRSIPGLEALLNPGKVILVGEIHGTKEGPGFIRHIVCHAIQHDLPVTVGLELPQSDEDDVKDYLQSKGEECDKHKILHLPFWSQDYQDGRASQAMFDLLESIRELAANKYEIGVLLLDKPDSDDRDLEMARRIIEAADGSPTNFIIALTGNYHNMIFDHSGQMGSYVLAKLGGERVVSLKQNYRGGSAWVDVAGEGFGPIGLTGDGIKEIGIFFDQDIVNIMALWRWIVYITSNQI